MQKIILKNINDTKDLAKNLSIELKKQNEIYLLLKGDLASGKTTLTKFIIKNLNINDTVSSPTFVIMNQYSSKNIRVNHLDLYRLNKTENLDLFTEEFENSINIIEWPDIITPYLENKKIITLKLSSINETKRICEIDINYYSDFRIKG